MIHDLTTGGSPAPLIPIGRDAAGVQTVNARDLHAFLEVGKDFSTWVKDRTEKLGFVEGRDFSTAEALSSPRSGSSKSRPQRMVEYHLSLEMAKHLAMIERTDRGMQAREYFLACERALTERRAVDPVLVLTDPAQLRGLLLNFSDRLIVAHATIEAQAPKVAALDLIAGTAGLTNIRDTAKLLQIRERRFTQWLQANDWCYRMKSDGHLVAYAAREKQGLLLMKSFEHKGPDGEPRYRPQTMVTAKGLARLAELIGRPIQPDLL